MPCTYTCKVCGGTRQTYPSRPVPEMCRVCHQQARHERMCGRAQPAKPPTLPPIPQPPAPICGQCTPLLQLHHAITAKDFMRAERLLRAAYVSADVRAELQDLIDHAEREHLKEATI